MVEWLPPQQRPNVTEKWGKLSLSPSLSPLNSLFSSCLPPLPPLCDAWLCTRVYACWRTTRAPGCPCVCLLVLRTEVMWEQQPWDSSAGCQSLEAFPLGCLQNRINMQYFAALVTETCPAHTNELKKCWSIFERVESISNRDQLKSLVRVKNKQNNRNRRNRATSYELKVCIKRIFWRCTEPDNEYRNINYVLCLWCSKVLSTTYC